MGVITEGIKEVGKKLLPKIGPTIIAAVLGIEVALLASYVVNTQTRIKAIESSLRKNKRRTARW